jgi:hypothetical protein
MPTMDTLAMAYARRRRKPPQPPPGVRHYLSDRHSGPAPQQVFHDGSVNPAGTGPFRRPRRGRTNPTPGSVLRRRNPQWN